MTLVTTPNYRLHTISRIKTRTRNDNERVTYVEDLPVEEGLNIERLCDDGEHYYVIATVYPEDNEDRARIEFVNFERMLSITSDTWPEFRRLSKIAFLIIAANNSEQED